MRTPTATRPLAFIFVALVTQSVAEINDEGRRGFPQAKPDSGSNHRVLTSSSSGKKIEVKVKAFQHLLNHLLILQADARCSLCYPNVTLRITICGRYLIVNTSHFPPFL